MDRSLVRCIARSGRVLACALLVIMVSGSVGSGATMQLFKGDQGTVFFPDEPVQMRLVVLLEGQDERSLTQPDVAYTVRDYWGSTVVEGRTPLQMAGSIGGRVDVAIDLPAEARGWFKVEFELFDGDSILPLRNTELPTEAPYVTFAVVDPPRQGPQPGWFFGICEHQLSDANAELMRRAGIRSLRIDVSWGGIQATSGGPFNWSRMDGIISTAERFDIDVLPIIDYTAPFAAVKLSGVREGSPSRYPPREDDWRYFVRSLVERYRESVNAWEVWNEANIHNFWLGTPGHYSNLLRQAYEEIRAADPSAAVSIAGTAGVDMTWFQDVVASGGGPYMDIVSVHPYRQPSPPEAGVVVDLVRTREWMENDLPPSAGGVVERPLWITEMGYHTLGNDAAVSEQAQAQFVVRAMTQALASGVERFYWYEFADGWIEDGDQEANFGLVYNNLMPKPAYAAYAAMERLLGQAHTPRTLAFDDRRLRAYAFDAADETVVVAWALDGEQTVEWPAEGPVDVVDLMGWRRTVEPTAGDSGSYVAVQLSGSPVYLIGLDLEAMAAEDIAFISDDPLAIKGGPATENDLNLVVNGSFEESAAGRDLPVGWNLHISRDADFAWEYRSELADAPHGNAYLRLRNNTPLGPHVYGRVYQQIQVKPWTTYTVTAKVRTKNNRKSWIGGGPGWAVRFQLPRDTGGEWQEFEGVFTTGSETSWDLMVLLEDIDEWVDVDDLRITEGVPPRR